MPMKVGIVTCVMLGKVQGFDRELHTVIFTPIGVSQHSRPTTHSQHKIRHKNYENSVVQLNK